MASASIDEEIAEAVRQYELLLNKEGSPNNTFLFQKYTSGEFIDKKDI